MKNEYYVAMFINDSFVNSSSVADGNKKHCCAVAKRLNRSAHKDVKWCVLPCSKH